MLEKFLVWALGYILVKLYTGKCVRGRLNDCQGTGVSRSWASYSFSYQTSVLGWVCWCERRNRRLKGVTIYVWLVGVLACFAALSTSSFPGMPLWPGAQTKTTGMKTFEHISRRGWMREMRRWAGEGWEKAFSDAKESETSKKGEVDGKDEVERTCWWLWSSASYTEAVFRCL